MVIQLVFFLLLSTIGVFIVDFQTIIYMWFIYIVGVVLSYIFNKGEDKTKAVRLYQTLFLVGAAYMFACYFYMTYHNYTHLLAVDPISYFLPRTESYMNEDSYWNALGVIWSDYDFFSRYHTGYFTYSTFFGFLGQAFDADFFVGQQISVLFLYPFVGILIYKLLQVNNLRGEKAYKYTVIISLFSVIFFFSSQVLRDIHVLLLYLMGIYLTFKKEFSSINLIKIIFIIYITTLFRIESGLFLVVLIPTYLMLTLQTSKYKFMVICFCVCFFMGILVLSLTFFEKIQGTFDKNQEIYVEGVKESSGMIGTLQKVPLVGNVASIIYNAAQPLPFWAKFIATPKDPRVELYNIMRFPQAIASLFNWLVLVYLFFLLVSKKIRRKTSGFISKPLQYQLWIGFVFLFLQSAVVDHRRIMAYYVIYYILFFIIFSRIENKDRKFIGAVAIGTFTFIQLIGLIYKV